MRVVQAVFGVFHHFELAHQLHRRRHLQRIYSTFPWARLKREGLPHDLVRTFPILNTAEYLLNRTGSVPPRLTAKLASWNALAFDRYTASKIVEENPEAFIAISGAGLLTGQRVQRNGGVFICDRGSTHQRHQEAVVLEEYKRWGIPLPLLKPHIVLREETIYAQSDAITVPSTIAKRSFIQMGVPAAKVHVIPYGVRLDKFHPAEDLSSSLHPERATRAETSLHAERTTRVEISRHPERATRVEGSPHLSLPADAFNLIFAGSVSLRKGIPYLLKAFAALKHPHKHLTIAGSIAAGIRPLLARLPTDNVTFTGSLSQPELATLMATSHALVLPSVEEGLALVQGQAMACGCPVIATVATGAEDLFSDGVEGFIVPNGDITTLTARMQQLAEDPALRRTMSAAAIVHVQTLGGWDTYGDRWDSLLQILTKNALSS